MAERDNIRTESTLDDLRKEVRLLLEAAQFRRKLRYMPAMLRFFRRHLKF